MQDISEQIIELMTRLRCDELIAFLILLGHKE